MDRLESMRAFVRVMETGGFAAAAREMGLSRSAVNRAVIGLEEALGAQLLRRSTRRVTPTETGRAFHDRCVAILADVDGALASVRELQEVPAGSLRVNAPMSFGTLHLAGLVAGFMREHPGIHVELTLNDRIVDPIEEGFDVTLRVGEPPVSTSLVTREIVKARRVVCASPGYIAAHGEPAHPGELRDHACLHYGYLASGSQWRLGGPRGEQSYAIGCVMWSNNGEVLCEAAIQGLGIALLPTFIAGAALQEGQLRSCLPQHPPRDLAVCALYPRHRHLSARVRLFVDALAARFGDRPYWDLVD